MDAINILARWYVQLSYSKLFFRLARIVLEKFQDLITCAIWAGSSLRLFTTITTSSMAPETL